MRIFDGADAAFTLYEDDGVAPTDASGSAVSGSATITFTWDDAAETLTVGKRMGDCDPTYPPCAGGRTLHIVRVAPGHGVGVAPTPKPDKVASYSGAEMTISLKA